MIHHRVGRRWVDNPLLNVYYLFAFHPSKSREIASSLEDEELTYLFYYFDFPSTLVSAITGGIRL